MKIFIYLILLVTVTFISCGGPKNLVSYNDNAEIAANTGDFSKATIAWKQFFAQTNNEEIEGSVYAKAAEHALKSGDSELALNWYDQARYKSFSSGDMYLALAKIYKSQQNISKELNALEFYTENFGLETQEVNSRLFEIYSEIKLNEKALQTWKLLNNESQNKISNLVAYFELNKQLKDSLVCDSVSILLLEKDAKQVDALEWNAKKYYWSGQNRYNLEMEKYNKNKTTRQYKILLKELDIVTEDFKKSLPFLQTLWEIEPGKEYAGYLANIYARFGDEKKAKFYVKYLK